jgi:hypothetical protein
MASSRSIVKSEGSRQLLRSHTLKTPEGHEKDDICRYLDSIKAWYFRPFMAGYGKSGVPDIVACVPGPNGQLGDGTFVAVEVKREGKEPTKLQYRRMAEVTAAGGRAFWGTAEKVVGEIEKWRNKNKFL